MTSHQRGVVGWYLKDRSCWKRRRRVLLVLVLVNQNQVYRILTPPKIFNIWREKGSIYPPSEYCIHDSVNIFPVKLNILQIGQLIPAFFHVSWEYNWECFNMHIHCPLLLEGNWNSHQLVVQKLLSLTQQKPSGCQGNSWGTCCNFLDEIFFSQSNWMSSIVATPFTTVFGIWQNYVASL